MSRRRTPHADYLVLISVDGLLPEYYLDSAWPAPAMQQLYREGVHARSVRPVFPSLSYPGHTTLVTGALPARHGICHDREIELSDDPAWLSEARLVRVPALWDAVRRAGGRTAAVGWPLTAGAPIDWNVPDVWPRDGEPGKLDAVRQAARPAGLFEEIEREATGRFQPEGLSSRYLVHDHHVAGMAAYLFERYRPMLLLVHAQAAVQIPQEPDWRNPRRPRAVAGSDHIVSVVLETVERLGLRDRTAIVVTGDHGMMEVHTAVFPNVWLVDAGLRGRAVDADWRATFHALGGSAFLRVHDGAGDDAATVRKLLRELPASMRAMFRVVDRAELDALGSDPEAPLALAAAPGFLLDQSADGPVTRPNRGMSHGHHPDEPGMRTGFVAAGPGFQPGAVAPLLPLECVAPLVAAVLGLDFDAPDGVLYPGLLVDQA